MMDIRIIRIFTFIYLFIQFTNSESNLTEDNFNLALRKAEMGFHKEAIKLLTKIIFDDSTYSDAFLYRAYSKHDIKDFRGAIKDYTIYLGHNPSNAHAYICRAYSYYNINPKAAIRDYTTGIKMGAESYASYYYRGKLYMKIKEFELALEDLEKSIYLAPDSLFLYFDLAFCKSELEDYVGSIKIYSIIINKGQATTQIFYNRGLAKLNLKDYRGAIVDFTKSIHIDENNESSYFLRGSSKYLLGDNRGCILDMNKVLAFSPNNEKAFYFRGISRIANNLTDSGCLDLSRAGELGYSDAYESIKNLCQ